jgi:hypothetical protein
VHIYSSTEGEGQPLKSFFFLGNVEALAFVERPAAAAAAAAAEGEEGKKAVVVKEGKESGMKEN